MIQKRSDVIARELELGKRGITFTSGSVIPAVGSGAVKEPRQQT